MRGGLGEGVIVGGREVGGNEGRLWGGGGGGSERGDWEGDE